VWRPCDRLETAVAWACALERDDGPSALCLSRQNVPRAAGDGTLAAHVRRGGYVLSEVVAPRAVIVATGSEVGLALAAQAELAAAGVSARVVSMPCTNRFDRQSAAYRDAVLPPELPVVAVEAAQPDFWHKYTGRDGAIVGMSTFGESAPAPVLYRHFGITTERVVAAVRRVVRPSRATTAREPELAAAK
jgi:transketolase